MRSPSSRLALLIAVLLMAGCASVVQGTMEGSRSVLVTSQPVGARVVHRGQTLGVTPCRVRVENWNLKDPVELTLDGYEPVRLTVVDGTNASLGGNLLFGGIGGIVIDVLNGSATRSKDSVHVQFEKPKTAK